MRIKILYRKTYLLLLTVFICSMVSPQNTAKEHPPGELTESCGYAVLDFLKTNYFNELTTDIELSGYKVPLGEILIARFLNLVGVGVPSYRQHPSVVEILLLMTRCLVHENQVLKIVPFLSLELKPLRNLAYTRIGKVSLTSDDESYVVWGCEACFPSKESVRVDVN